MDDQLDPALKDWQVLPIQAQMAGYINESFKDLMRKMLLSDPCRRPCTADMLDENDENFTQQRC